MNYGITRLEANAGRRIFVSFLAFSVVSTMFVACGTPDAQKRTASSVELKQSVNSFDAEEAYDEFEERFRLYYAYLDRPDFDVDRQLGFTREAAKKARNPKEFRQILNLALLAFTDPHILVTPPGEESLNVWPTSSDMAIELVGESFVVVDVRTDGPASAAGVEPGWTVLTIDGTPIDESVSDLLRNVVKPTPSQRSYAATLAVNGRRNGLARKLEMQSTAGEVSVKELGNPREFADEVSKRAPVEVTTFDGVPVIRFNNSLGDLKTIDAFDKLIARNVNADAIILDLRNTPSGGNTDVARAIIGHFVSEPRPYQLHEIPAVEKKTGVPRRFVEYVLPRQPLYTGSVAVLGSRWTGSMGEGIVIGFDATTSACTISSRMGRLLGALHQLPLDRSVSTLELGVEALFHVDGTPRAEYVPDVKVSAAERKSPDDDPALTEALSIIRTNGCR